MRQLWKKCRVPALIVGGLCLLIAGTLIAVRVQAVKKGGQSAAQSAQTDSGDGSQTAAAPQTDDACTVVFSDGAVRTSADGDAVEISGTAVTVCAPGTYVLSGSCANGSVTVKKQTEGVVLVLDGLDLTADGTAAICCNKGAEVTIRAAEGSVNTLADTETNNDETDPANENAENAVIKCKDGARVTLCGDGALNLTANGKNGVKSGASTDEFGEASLSIRELTLSVTAVNDGIKGETAVNLLSGELTVSAGGDGVSCDGAVNVGAEGTDGPVLRITDSEEGIEGAEIRLLSGDVRIAARDDGVNASSDTGASALSISGGSVYVDAREGDGLDSNGSLTISGGELTVFSSSRSDNAPLDSADGMQITGGTVLAVGASGMAEPPAAAEQCYVRFGGTGGFGGRGGFGRMDAGNAAGPSDAADAPDAADGSGPMGDAIAPDGGSGLRIAAGDKLQVLSADGTVLAEAEAPRAADYVFFSSPALTDGESCTLSVNGAEAAAAEAGTETGAAGFGPGGQGGRPQMPDGEFDPDNMPQMPGGGEFDPDNMPQMPEGEFDPDNMPQMPDGEFDPADRPEPPEGGFGPGNGPRMPGGGPGPGGAGQDGEQSSPTPDAGDGNDL